MINFTLHRNATLENPNQCTAQVRSAGTADLEAIVEFMMQTATVAKPDVLGVLEGFFHAVEYLLLDGKCVCTPVAVFRSAVQGLFVDELDGFDPSRHAIRAAVSAGKRLRRAVRMQAQVNKVHGVAPTPVPKRFCDIESGQDNAALTPGGQGRVLGLHLHFDPDDPQQGVFFLAAEGTAYRAGRPARNMPGELIMIVPALPAGTYSLEVRAAFNGAGDLRAGKLKDALTVS
jgi:hypothetical protein